MANVDKAQLHDFVNGETVDEAKLDQNFEVLRVAGNDTNTKVNTITTTAALKGANSDITSMSGITGGISTVDYIDVDQTPTAGQAVGRLKWNATDGTLEVGLVGGNVNLQIGQEEVLRVLNNTGSPMTNGQVVYVTGASGQRPTVALALGTSDATSARTIGILTENIANNAQGFVTMSGIVNDVNTSAFAEGSALWLSATTPGAITTTRPVAPNHGVLVGFCIRSHATQGQILVKVQNGFELDELHDVLIGTKANGDILAYDTVSGVWKNKTRAELGLAPLASPTFTGVVTVPAPVNGTDATTKTYVDTADGTKVSKSGDTMTGALTLSGNPTVSAHAANKSYVDTQDAARVAKTGDTMTGSLTLPGNPTSNLEAAPKQYVDQQIANLINSAPGTLDTLNEIATALGNDPNFATTMTNQLATKAPLASPALTGTPTAPTAVSGTNTTQIATTAFVQTAVNNLPAGSVNTADLADGAVTAAKIDPAITTTVGLGVLQTQVDGIQNSLSVPTYTTTSLVKGTQLVTATQAGSATPTIFGKTLVNILGNDGNCESLTGWALSNSPTLSTTQVKTGINSFKFASTVSSVVYRDYTYKLDTTKQYFLGAWAFIESFTDGAIRLRINDYQSSTSRYQLNLDTSIVGSWQFVYIKIPTSNLVTTDGFRLYLGATSGVSTSYFDSIRLYEVDSTTYNAIGSTITPTTTPSIDDVLPYVDNVKHVVNPTLVKSGKNLLPPFTQWTRHANTVVNSNYSLTLNATAVYQQAYVDIQCIPNTTYTLSATTNARMYIESYDANKSSLGVLGVTSNITSVVDKIKTVTTQSNAYYIRVYLDNYTTTTGTYTFTNPQIELGSTATTFEPQNNDYIYGEATLASNIDGTVRDSLTVRDGVWRKTKNWQTDVVLDGSLSWISHTSNAGNKVVRVSITGTSITEVVSKFDGKLLKRNTGGTATYSPDDCILSSNLFYVAIGQTDTGFGDSHTPSSAEIRAYFYGWKMNNGTFGTPYNGTGTKTWTLWNATDNTGAVTTVPTTLASGFTPYKLSYQLSTPTEEVVNVEGDIALHNGTNQITLGEGVIVREKVTPFLSGSTYFINSTNSGAYLSKRASSIIAVYNNGRLDTRWTIATSGTVNGAGVASTASANFDTTAEYTVTYQALDEYALTANATSASIYYATNVGAAVSEAIKVVNDLNTMSDNFATKSEVSDLRNDALLKTGGTITGTLKIQQTVEKINVVASAPTTNIDLLDGAIDYFTSNTTANFTLNFRGNASSTLNSILAVGENTTISVMVTNGATAYYPNVIQVDGTTRTVKWNGGTAPTSGDASAINIYTFNIIKTASDTYTILGTVSKFA